MGIGGLPPCCQRLLKVGHVQRKVGIRAPLDCMRVKPDKLVGVWQVAAQRVQQIPQIGARLFFGGIGPEGIGQLLPGDRRLPVQQQIDQQTLWPFRVQGGDGLPPLPERKVA